MFEKLKNKIIGWLTSFVLEHGDNEIIESIVLDRVRISVMVGGEMLMDGGAGELLSVQAFTLKPFEVFVRGQYVNLKIAKMEKFVS